MSISKAPGADGINEAILRKAWPIISEDIPGLFGKCLGKAVFPSAWRNARLIVIPKSRKKDITDPKAYRPSSLLPSLGKALETLIIQDLERETSLNDFENQHGFVPGKSTIKAMRRVYE